MVGQFSQLLEQTDTCISYFTPEGLLVDINQTAMCLVPKKNREEIIGQRAFDIFGASLDSRIKEVVATRQSHTYEDFTGKHWIRHDVTPLLDKQSNVQGVLVLSTQLQDRTPLSHTADTYRALFEQANDAILIIREETNTIADANQAAQTLLDFPATELIGMRVFDLIPSFIRRKVEANWNLQTATNGELYIDTVWLDAAENRIDVSINGKRLMIGGTSYLQVIARDIRAQKRAEYQLRSTLNEFKLAIDTAKLGVWHYDFATERLSWNNHMLDIYGLSRDTFDESLNAWQKQIHPEDVDYTLGRFNEVSEGKIVHDVAFRIIRPNGDLRYLLASGAPAFDENHEVKGLVGINIDVTLYYNTEQAIRESEERYRGLFTHTASGIIVTNDDGRIVDANPATRALLGESIMGRLIQSFALNDLPWEEYIKAGLVETELVMGDAKQHHVEFRLVANIQPGLHMCVIKDISARKRAEAELRTHQLLLEKLVEQRTAELSKAYDELRDLNHLKDEWVSNVSHELRTPLTSIKLRHHLIKEDPNKLGKHLDVLQRETYRLEALIEGLLNLSRMDQKRMTINMGETHLSPVLENAVSDRQLVAKEKRINLNFVPPSEIPHVMADPRLVEQVLNVLLTNALNYTPEGGRITVSAWATDDWAGFTVSDTGVGIPHKEIDKLFTRFYRGKNALQSGASGTGLGLAIAKEIMDLHNGKITVESTPNVGSRFMVWLPLYKTNEHVTSNS